MQAHWTKTLRSKSNLHQQYEPMKKDSDLVVGFTTQSLCAVIFQNNSPPPPTKKITQMPFCKIQAIASVHLSSSFHPRNNRERYPLMVVSSFSHERSSQPPPSITHSISKPLITRREKLAQLLSVLGRSLSFTQTMGPLKALVTSVSFD